jgi:hypothetical protein
VKKAKSDEPDEQELRNALKDLSVNEAAINEIIAAWKEGQTENVKSRLRLLRSSTLSDVHEKQNKLYCIDFILRKLM